MSGTEEATPTITASASGGAPKTRPNTAPTPGIRQRHVKKVRQGHPLTRSGSGGGGSSVVASCSDKNGPRTRLLAYVRQINPPSIPAPNPRVPSGTAEGDFAGGEGKVVAITGAPRCNAGGEVIGGDGKQVAVTGAPLATAAAAAAVDMGNGTERMGCGAKLAAMRAARWRRREKEEDDARKQARRETSFLSLRPFHTSDSSRSTVDHVDLNFVCR